MFAEKMSHEAPLVQPMQPVFGANLGLDASQIAQSQTTMMMNEHKSWSAGDFSITRDDGSEMFKSQGKFKSLTERRELYDAAGNHLFTLRRHKMGFTKAFFIEDPQENRLAEFKWHVSMHMKLDVTFKNTAQDGQEVTLLVRPDENKHLKKRDIEILRDGQQIAKVRREGNYSNIVKMNNKYGIYVSAGVDVALISLIALAIDAGIQQCYGGLIAGGSGSGAAAAAGAGA